MTVAAVLKRKAFQAAVVAPTDRITEVARTLAERRADAALVVDRADQLLGVVAASDIVESLAANAAGTLEMTAGQLMTKPVRSVTPATSIAEAMRVMVSSRLRSLPVFDGAGNLVGMVGLDDLVRANVAREQADLAA